MIPRASKWAERKQIFFEKCPYFFPLVGLLLRVPAVFHTNLCKFAKNYAVSRSMRIDCAKVKLNSSIHWYRFVVGFLLALAPRPISYGIYRMNLRLMVPRIVDEHFPVLFVKFLQQIPSFSWFSCGTVHSPNHTLPNFRLFEMKHWTKRKKKCGC